MKKLITGVALVYVVMLALLWALQGRLIHHPNVPGRDLQAAPEARGLPYREVEIETEDGERLHGWFLPAPEPRAALLFFHGNAGNISHRLDSLALFHQLGLSVLIIDYRGYGRSTGRPEEQGLYRDARASLDYLRELGWRDEQIIAFGRSLGGAVAAQLVSEQRLGALILESTFTSVADMAARIYPVFPVRPLVRQHYDARAAVRRVDVPVLVIHSPEDEIIPYEHGRELYEAASSPRRFLEISGDHNRGFLLSRDRYLAGIEAFLEEHGFEGGRSQ